MPMISFSKMTFLNTSCILVFMLSQGQALAKPKGKGWTTVEAAKAENPDFMIQGEYGSSKDGMGVQVVALGDGKFDAYFLEGGLPGDGWDKSKKRVQVNGTTSFEAEGIKASIANSAITLTWGDKKATLKRVERESPTLGKKAPENAVILFDGTSVDAWTNGKMKDGMLLHGTTSKEKFQSYTLHLEFMTPYRPFDRGQGRGNSGVYHQGRYETQVLDSFGLDGKMNEAGGIYSIAHPKLNMCFPPLRWQTYDVDLTAAVYEDSKKVKDASMTVRLNGVVVQENVKLPKHTPAAPVKMGPEPGPIYLQNHGNPVFYRNIWVVKK